MTLSDEIKKLKKEIKELRAALQDASGRNVTLHCENLELKRESKDGNTLIRRLKKEMDYLHTQVKHSCGYECEVARLISEAEAHLKKEGE